MRSAWPGLSTTYSLSFFTVARDLETLTPPWLHFRVVTPGPIRMQVGTRIDYRLRLHGVPLRWQSEITAYSPPLKFVDEQRHGPYRRWMHTHTFELQDGGTLVRDHVAFTVWGGRPVERFLVAPDVAPIFDYRRRALLILFGDRAAV